MITFGSLTPLPSQDQILALHGEFRRKASLLKPLIEAVRDLPLLWGKMTDQNPALSVLDGEAAIMKLEGLVSGPANEHILDEKHNILIVPITILTHVTLYLSFLEHSEAANHNSVLEDVVAMGGVQGLCAGLLSAQAVASAQTVEDVVALSCVSLRLAFCIGAYVDANQFSINGGNDESVTLAVRWNPPETLEDVKKILLNHPKVYLAAVRDERDITITTPAEAATTLREDLSQNGLSFLEIGLNGRYHTSIHAGIPLKIINACEDRLDPRFGSRELVRSNFDGQVIPRHEAVSELLESILVQHVNWYLTISTSAQCISQASEQPLILSIGGDTTAQSIKKIHHVVMVIS
ncbi:hypothetical protein EKO27_g3412 [Xylaria grammica]|uniref:Starter acyltransferase (SAT) domain-containing protein n=1 Tax=Xylaria grammica TaxID=363999 RepID=A0A439DBA5_9PEZI|nr:hypothetical protein EKO27_g3412 [Xylaria grammica]